ncbi:radical SAM protein [Ethanoligenens sp.]|uniref:radical SAM protein n=1 Tax=Ethanoligenens sp. TaxID=2099655 RepID=UPI0039E7E834
MNLSEKQLAIHVTTKCTLNCKTCATIMPEFRKRACGEHVPLEQLKHEINCLFEIYDYIENLTISGGEPLLYPSIYELANYCLNYSKKFGDLRIFFNGTIIPDQKLVDVIKSSDGKLKLVVDDYGAALSKNTAQIADLWKANGMELRVIQYYGDHQHCGGWIDNGHPIQKKHYPDAGKAVFSRCHLAQYSCPATLKGKLHNCSWSTMLVELGYISKNVGLPEFVDMFNNDIPLEVKKQRVSQFGKQLLEACNWCNGFDPENSPRFPAGEQA